MIITYENDDHYELLFFKENKNESQYINNMTTQINEITENEIDLKQIGLNSQNEEKYIDDINNDNILNKKSHILL